MSLGAPKTGFSFIRFSFVCIFIVSYQCCLHFRVVSWSQFDLV